MSWTKRTLDYMRDGYSEADAIALVVAERKRAEDEARSAANPAEVPSVRNTQPLRRRTEKSRG